MVQSDKAGAPLPRKGKQEQLVIKTEIRSVILMWPDCKDKAVSLVALGLHGEEQSLELPAFEKYTMAASGMSLLLRRRGISFKEIITAQKSNIYLFASRYMGYGVN